MRVPVVGRAAEERRERIAQVVTVGHEREPDVADDERHACSHRPGHHATHVPMIESGAAGDTGAMTERNVLERNVLGGPLEPCGTDPLTGFYRDGCCNTGPEDRGSHTVCAVVSAEFLDHQRGIGNDLVTAMPQYRFPGLVPGDRWCVTAANWLRRALRRRGRACRARVDARARARHHPAHDPRGARGRRAARPQCARSVAANVLIVSSTSPSG